MVGAVGGFGSAVEDLKPSYRVKIRRVRDDYSREGEFATGHPIYEVFVVNGEWLSTPVRLNDWLEKHVGEMANLYVEPV